MRNRTSTTALALPLLLASPEPARAQSGQPEVVSLRWMRGEGASGCPGAPQAERDIAARIGRFPFSPSAPRVISVLFTRTDGHWTARVDESNAGVAAGTRTLPSEAADCSALYSATVLVLSLLIDAEHTRSAPTPPEASTSPPQALSPAPSAARTARHSSPDQGRHEVAELSSKGAPPARPLSAHLRARFVSAFGLLPETTFGPALSASVGGTVFEGYTGMFLLPESKTLDERFGFGLTAGWLGVCARPLRFARGSAGLCGAFSAGVYHGVVHDLATYEPVHPGDRGWAALTFSPDVRLSVLGPLFIEAGAELVVPLARHSFQVDGEAFFVIPPIGAMTFVGLGVAVP
ncbi:MAG: hypothetical protein R3B70_10110 [Polyangiaceae bacterium]